MNKISSPEHQKHIHGKVTSPADMPDWENYSKTMPRDKWGTITFVEGQTVSVGGREFRVSFVGQDTVLEAV